MLLTMYRHSIYFIFPPSAFSAVVNARIPRTSREDTADVSKMTTGKECLLLIYVMDDILYTISSKSFMQLKHMDGYRVQKVPNRCMIGDFHIIDGKIFFFVLHPLCIHKCSGTRTYLFPWSSIKSPPPPHLLYLSFVHNLIVSGPVDPRRSRRICENITI